MDYGVIKRVQQALYESQALNTLRWGYLIDSITVPIDPPEDFTLMIASEIWLHLVRDWADPTHAGSFDEAIKHQIGLLADVRNKKPNARSFERCEICDGIIPLENLCSAKCVNGHQFGMFFIIIYPAYRIQTHDQAIVRCGLTFLALQKPGISKRCGICRRQYFNVRVERSHIILDFTFHNTLVEGQTASSLSRILFLACDTCVYCGGKFCG